MVFPSTFFYQREEAEAQSIDMLQFLAEQTLTGQAREHGK